MAAVGMCHKWILLELLVDSQGESTVEKMFTPKLNVGSRKCLEQITEFLEVDYVTIEIQVASSVNLQVPLPNQTKVNRYNENVYQKKDSC